MPLFGSELPLQLRRRRANRGSQVNGFDFIASSVSRSAFEACSIESTPAFSALRAPSVVVACAATLHSAGITTIRDAADAAQALRPLAGKYAYLLFAAGLFNASLFAASILPLSTAYTVCEGLGFESGVDKKFREAPEDTALAAD